MVVAPSSLQEKFDRLSVKLGGELMERTAVIDTQILALLSQTHHFQLGSPGIAKSLSTRRLMAHIGGLEVHDYYETLMTRFTVMEEVFGPLDLAALKQGRYRHVTDSYAPNAQIWFLDEIWKSNASILNSLLMALNERLFRNDGAVHELPLWSMFCASNEMPEGEELAALYDRIHFRLVIRPIQEQGNFISMMKLKYQDDEKIVTWDDIQKAQAEVAQVEIPDDVLEGLNSIRNDLKIDGIEPTDRRFRDCLKIVQAAAWLDGEERADLHHINPLVHCFWSEPSNFPIVERIIADLANPLDKEAMNLRDDVDGISLEIDRIMQDKDMEQGLRNKKGVELHGKVEKARKELTKLRKEIQKAGRKSVIADEVHNRLIVVTERLVTDLFNIDAEKGKIPMPPSDDEDEDE